MRRAGAAGAYRAPAGRRIRLFLWPRVRCRLSCRRRQLEDFRAALKHYHVEGYVTTIPAIVLPEKPVGRQRWLTRAEAERLILAAWRMRQTWKGVASDRRTGQHVARFTLVALYTGTRSGAVCEAAIRPTPGQAFVDLARGVFYRRAEGGRETKKRRPPVSSQTACSLISAVGPRHPSKSRRRREGRAKQSAG